MQTVAKLTLGLFAAAAISSPAHAADMFLTMGPVTGEGVAARKGKESKVEILSWQYGTARKGWDGSVKGGSASAKKHVPSGTHIASADLDGDGRAAAAPGLATGSPALEWTSLATPAARGSVRIKVKFPWLDCKAGNKISSATLTSSTERVTFSDISVSRCATDEVDLDYASVVVRGWNPETKQP